jgi:hypothetical protein
MTEIFVFYNSKEGFFNKKVIRLIQQFNLKRYVRCVNVVYDQSKIDLLPESIEYTPAMAIYEPIPNKAPKKALTFACQKKKVFDSLIRLFNLSEIVNPSKKQYEKPQYELPKKNTKAMSQLEKKKFFNNVHMNVGANHEHEFIDQEVINMQPDIEDFKPERNKSKVHNADDYSLKGVVQSSHISKANPRIKRFKGTEYPHIINLMKGMKTDNNGMPLTIDCHMKK